MHNSFVNQEALLAIASKKDYSKTFTHCCNKLSTRLTDLLKQRRVFFYLKSLDAGAHSWQIQRIISL